MSERSYYSNADRTETTVVDRSESGTGEWWSNPALDLADDEVACGPCRGLGEDRWHGDCASCGGLGVVPR